MPILLIPSRMALWMFDKQDGDTEKRGDNENEGLRETSNGKCKILLVKI